MHMGPAKAKPEGEVTLPIDFEPVEIDTCGKRSHTARLNDFQKYKVVNRLCREAMQSVFDECKSRGDMGFLGTHRGSAIEVGTWAGANAIAMVEGIDELNHLYCVDTWKGGHDTNGITAGVLGPKTVFQTFCRNTRKWLYKRIIPCVGHSKTYAEIWPFKVAFILVDADHTFESCKEDLEAWWPHIAPGGIIAGHDYISFPPVRKAADEFGIDGSEDEIFWKKKVTA